MSKVTQSEPTELTAAQARQLVVEAESIKGAFAREETTRALSIVAKAASQAQSSVRVDLGEDVATVVVKRLRSLGYTVKHESGDDPRDNDSWSYLIISW